MPPGEGLWKDHIGVDGEVHHGGANVEVEAVEHGVGVLHYCKRLEATAINAVLLLVCGGTGCVL